MMDWVVKHDDRWLFTIFYVGLAIVLSVFISIFWLVVLVAIHAALEWYALEKSDPHSPKSLQIIWHLKLDIVLIIFALWLGLYIDAIFGLLGLGPAARAGAQVGSRALAWQRATRGVLLTLDDVAHVGKAVMAKRNNGGAETDVVDDDSTVESSWATDWSFGDHLTVWFGVALLVMIVLTPWLTDHTLASTMASLQADLHPWPR